MSDLHTLSLFRLISRAPSQNLVHFDESILARQLFEELDLQFETTVPALARMCYRMEHAVLARHAREGEIYVGFQRLSRFTPQVAARYLRMAEAGNRTFIFGVPDTDQLPQHPNLRYVPLALSDSLVDEWFLVIDTPQYSSALSALDLVGFDAATSVDERLFTGVKTGAAKLTQELAESLRAALAVTTPSR